MTEKTNLFPNLIRFRETNRLKMAIAASIMLWCATPQQAAADTYEKHEIASV
ncbi:putative TonB-dependent outer membrane receptor domain protein, partial [Bacteroides fragilis str. S6L8]